ncbi:VC0807 family protein [Rummeliibacillus sp. TYF-LIM-RU47]|uniref:VC0807 family protein n=1 Tax=Rummeliibacillus sp. TYF-LIM-RU47 TaxID=2608406 RepID=UPI00123B351B|nr:VC0807 family protein [Rummeliibacillus sp. TYF-LIM-RU47]
MVKKQQSNKKSILMDLIFYAALPYFIWKFGREPFGDYIAMLITTIPGFVYTIYSFIIDKQFNFTGIFILGTLAIGTTVDLLSGSAEQMIWNGVYLSLFYSSFYFVLLVMKRPVSLYFAIDFVYLQGHERKASKTLFFQKGIFKWFQYIQVIYIIRGLFMSGLTVFLLKNYGLDGYGEMLVFKQIANWIFSGLIIGLFFYINIPVQNYIVKQENQLQKNNNITREESKVVAE